MELDGDKSSDLNTTYLFSLKKTHCRNGIQRFLALSAFSNHHNYPLSNLSSICVRPTSLPKPRERHLRIWSALFGHLFLSLTYQASVFVLLPQRDHKKDMCASGLHYLYLFHTHGESLERKQCGCVWAF